MNARTIMDLLAPARDDAPAVGAPEQDGLSYLELRELVERTTARLNGLGLGEGDAVAIVLPNGPEMATAFVTMAASVTTAPLNPAYRQEEFEFYLEDLEARALVCLKGEETPARAAAEKLGITVIDLVPGDKAGDFTLEGAAAGPARDDGMQGPEAIALVLHTSGTTSRPKIVPLSQRNICASANNVAASLALTSEDRCLNVMPLFHIHGLIAAVLSSLSAGAFISCTPGFNALRFFAWMDEVKPSWYTAVPTMHQAVLSRAPRNADSVKAAKLRFIRSSSASLPPQVMVALEETFGAPVIEAYGMTEAAHQMAANPLPPEERKPGAVGREAGPEVRIMDNDGRLLASGETGEVVIRGENVFSGYRNNPEANAEAFTDGWFRTGDQGVIDEAGYLRITGRLKEIINRGGEKVSPREVDEVLMDHPAVAQAVTFALPHEKLGEDVAAAIVLREGGVATEAQIREFAGNRLADFKVPRKVVFLDEIPKGATGKLQRIGLADKLGLTS
jgi:acyl-CoA synthetase (AMP-forming)/AMP-acid ligase II